jgi:diketogulonate reductase-like aldo/keto reductase
MIFKMNENGSCQIEESTYPAVGFGTYPLKEDICFKALMQAGQLGYRIIDTATFYQNFEPIGNALKILGRENFYLISKVWPNNHTPEKLREDIEMTLSQLQTDHLDAYLLHWPNSKISIEDTLYTMENLRKSRMIPHIGFSNFTV